MSIVPIAPKATLASWRRIALRVLRACSALENAVSIDATTMAAHLGDRDRFLARIRADLAVSLMRAVVQHGLVQFKEEREASGGLILTARLNLVRNVAEFTRLESEAAALQAMPQEKEEPSDGDAQQTKG